MQKKFNLAVVAAALVTVLSTSANAENVAELSAKNISGDLAVLAIQAQNDGWNIVSTSEDTIKMQRSLSETRLLTGVQRWKRVTNTVDATVVAKLTNGKIVLSTETDIKSAGHKQQLKDALASLEQAWHTGVKTASARHAEQSITTF